MYGSNGASEKLMQIGIDVNSIKFEHYSAKDISRLDLTIGNIKSSNSENVINWKFNQVHINDSGRNGKEIFLSLYPATENDLVDIVDSLSKVLGIDSAGRLKLLDYELIIYRNDASPNFPIREWKDFGDYYVDLKGLSRTQSVILFLRRK